MNKLAKQYVKEAKAFFPIVRKQEKKYLKQLENTIDEYCQRRFDVLSKEKIYEEFGTPSEIAYSYFSNLEISFLLKRINITKTVKAFLIAITLLLLVGASALSIYLYHTYNLIESQMIFSEDTFIE